MPALLRESTGIRVGYAVNRIPIQESSAIVSAKSPHMFDFGIPNHSNARMESIDAELAGRIRNDIIFGEYSEGERLSELQLCEQHNVSRTPVRLALRLLEREGVIRRSKGRGYFVRRPTLEGIMQAVLVRGHLESLAARLMAQSPGRSRHLPGMAHAIETIDDLVRAGSLDEAMVRKAQAANTVFHTTILAACGNECVGYACAQISHLPMLAVGSMVFDRAVGDSPEQVESGLFRLRLGNAQHQVVYNAIDKGDPVRAEGMMREHSHTMIEYIQTFERRSKSPTVADLVAYGAVPAQPIEAEEEE